MSNKKVSVVKLKALKKRMEETRMRLSKLIQEIRQRCHHPKSCRVHHTEVRESGILGQYETEITHETCGICGHYIGDIP